MSSPFSGKAGRNAAIWTSDYLGDIKDGNNQNFDQGLRNSVDALSNARQQYAGAIPNQLGAINTGADQGLARLGQAADLYRPAYARGEQASGTYMDSLGLNGAEGNQRAVNSFQAGPGYQWSVDQATDAAARNASKLGIAGSGNTLTALATLGNNLANQEYGGWQDRLQGVGQQGQQAAGGIASALTGQAGIDVSRGNALSGIYGQNAQNLAGTYGAEAGLYSQDATNRVNNQQWAANQITQAGQQGMLAGQNAAANKFNAGMQGLQLGASLLGGFSGGGGLGGALGGLGRLGSNVASGGFTGMSPNYSYGAGGYTGAGPFV